MAQGGRQRMVTEVRLPEFRSKPQDNAAGVIRYRAVRLQVQKAAALNRRYSHGGGSRVAELGLALVQLRERFHSDGG
jgi:hypothetical protein